MTIAVLPIPRWVPLAAADTLRQLSQIHRRHEERERIHRLATYEVMKTDVWQKLPRLPAGQEGEIVETAFFLSRPDIVAFMRTGNLPMLDLPSAPWLDRCLNPSLPDMVKYGDGLFQGMFRWGAMYREEWEARNKGTRIENFTETALIVHDVAAFFAEMDEDREDLLAGLPRIRKKNAANVAELFFSPMMALRLLMIYDDPLLSVVTAMTEVVFDKAGGVSLDTTRSRWRAFLKGYGW